MRQGLCQFWWMLMAAICAVSLLTSPLAANRDTTPTPRCHEIDSTSVPDLPEPLNSWIEFYCSDHYQLMVGAEPFRWHALDPPASSFDALWPGDPLYNDETRLDFSLHSVERQAIDEHIRTVLKIGSDFPALADHLLLDLDSWKVVFGNNRDDYVLELYIFVDAALPRLVAVCASPCEDRVGVALVRTIGSPRELPNGQFWLFR